MTDKEKLEVQRQLILELQKENEDLKERNRKLQLKVNVLSKTMDEVELDMIAKRQKLKELIQQYRELLSNMRTVHNRYESAENRYSSVTGKAIQEVKDLLHFMNRKF